MNTSSLPHFFAGDLEGSNPGESYRRLLRIEEAIETMLACLPTERPDFGPTQVRSEDDLVVGRRYRQHNAIYAEMLTLKSLPYYSDGDLCVKVIYDNLIEKILVLADSGVVPYITEDVERWHDTNWLEDTTLC
jgi:hypothetical protein